MRRVSTLIILFSVLLAISGCSSSGAAASVENTANNDTTAENDPVVAETEESTPEPVEETPAEETPAVADAAEAEEAEPTEVPTEAPVIAETVMNYPEIWKDMPVVPSPISNKMREVYLRGQEMGRDPHAFSIIGDCQNVSAFFLSGFGDPNLYQLGPYDELQGAVDWFNVSDSFARDRVAVEGGYNVAAVLSPLWNDAEVCDSRESPLACEYRINNPSYALISMETWWYDRPAETYANYLRQIVEYTMEQGVIPILATKADNIEGEFMEDWAINKAIVQVAQEYDVPLWNFWAASYPLPDHGLRLAEGDPFHLSYEGPMFHFYDPVNMENGWPMRNLTALQTLDAVWRGVTQEDN